MTAALERMEASLDTWEQSQRATEARLKARAGITPAEMALFYAEEGRLDEAVRAMDGAIAADPTRGPLYVFQGLLHEAAGHRPEAAAVFATAGKVAPADPVAAYLAAARPPGTVEPDDLRPFVAALMVATDRGAAARLRAPFVEFRLIHDASAAAPVFTPAAYADAFTLFAGNRFREAVQRLRAVAAGDALVADPAGRDARALAGIAALREKRGDAAIEQLRAAVAALPKSAEAHRILGVAYRAVARLPESIRHLEEAIVLAPRDERARVTLGATLAEAGMLSDAERVLRETVGMMPASGEARWALADVYDKLGRGLDAITSLEEATALTVVAGKAALYWRLAELAHRHQDYEGVVLALYHRAKLVPNEPHTHKDLGLAYFRFGRADEALVELLMTSLLGVEDVETLATIGQIHLMADRFEAAEAVLRRAVAADPKNAQSQYALGSTLMRVGKADEAKQHLDAFRRLRTEALKEQQRKFEQEALPREGR